LREIISGAGGVREHLAETGNGAATDDPVRTQCRRHALMSRSLSSHLYDDLALCVTFFNIVQRFGGRWEWKDPIYNRTYSTGIDEGPELAQLASTWFHK
jgi:hypothetical protein